MSSAAFDPAEEKANIELVIRCSSFGFNKTVLKELQPQRANGGELENLQMPALRSTKVGFEEWFSKSITESQLGKEDTEEAEEGAVAEEDEADDEGLVARQKYFRHIIFWLSMQDNITSIPMIVQDAFVRMMCVLLKPHELEDVLHNRFTAKQRRMRSNAHAPTDTVVLLLRWFTEYFRRFPELHLFSNRISPVVEAIDERVTYELSPFFVRDHIFLLFTQVLQAYNIQRTWGKDWFSSYARGGAEDQAPNISEPIFADLVKRHAFEHAEKEHDAMGSGQARREAEAEDDRANMTDTLGDLFKVLFNQHWAAEDWGVDQELMHIVKMILSLNLCDAQETVAAKGCLQRLGVGLDQDFQTVEHAGDDFDDPEAQEGAGQDEDSDSEGEGNKKNIVGLHRGFVGREDELYTPAFKSLKPTEDFGGRLPELTRTGASQRRLRQQDHLQDFLYELVAMPDLSLAKSLHVDVNLWRRQQIQHSTFLLKGSQERIWHVGKEIVQKLQGLNLKMTAGEHLLQEFSCEVHVLRPGDGNAGLWIEKADKKQYKEVTATHWRGHGTAGKGQVGNQIYFEVEVNGKDVVYLRNMSFELGRVKVRLQLLGCHTLTLRSRCLFDTREFQIVVSNPRMMALTSPKAFDPEVVLRAAKIGAKRHADSLRPPLQEHNHQESHQHGGGGGRPWRQEGHHGQEGHTRADAEVHGEGD
ncbi:unnamed protein product [Effrenium voratum]|nr:unnamed protein product [Effrenium voratum]